MQEPNPPPTKADQLTYEQFLAYVMDKEGRFEYVDGRAAMVLQGPLAKVKRGIRGYSGRNCCSPSRLQFQMPIAACDMNDSGTDRISLMSFADLQRTPAVQALGKQARKDLRHMLDD